MPSHHIPLVFCKVQKSLLLPDLAEVLAMDKINYVMFCVTVKHSIMFDKIKEVSMTLKSQADTLCKLTLFLTEQCLSLALNFHSVSFQPINFHAIV